MLNRLKINPYVDAITPYQPGKPIEEVARELNLNPDSIAKLASNECPLGPSPKAIQAIKKYASDMHFYPDGGAYYLRKKLATKFSLPESNFIFGNGSNEILELIAHCFISKDSSVVTSKHSFIVYKLLTQMFGAELIEISMDDNLTYDLSSIANAIKDNTKVIFICNPNNPTGSMVNEQEITAFMNKVPNDILVVFDEAYAELAMNKMPNSLNYICETRNVIILRTFSKAYGLAGLRIGYGIAKPELITALNKPRQPFNVNRMAQYAAIAAIDDQEFIKKSKILYKKGAELIISFCKSNNIEFIPPNGNFILIKVGDGVKVFEKLQKEGIIVRPMTPYLLPEWIRITFGKEDENIKLIETLRNVLKNDNK